MTLKDVIVRFDTECRNNVPDEIKVGWLSDLDNTVYTEIFLTHEQKKDLVFSGYTTKTPEDTVLLIPDAYADLYIRYLTLKTALFYGDVGRYNNEIILYSAAYGDFERYYHRTHAPLKETEHFNI